MSDTAFPAPIVHSEKGYDQSDVPAERANATPDAEPEVIECDPARDLHATPHNGGGCILR